MLLSRIIFFKKVVIIPKGKLPKVKGSLCNILINKVYDNYQSLPKPTDSNGLLIVKLKHKAQYFTYVLFEPGRPVFFECFLKYLKKYNHIYLNTETDMDNLPLDLLDWKNGLNNNNNNNSNNNNNVDDHSSSSRTMILDLLRYCIRNSWRRRSFRWHLVQFRSVSDEATFMSEITTITGIKEAIVITPSEGKQPVLLLGDEFCEERAHSHLFPYEKIGYKTERKMLISPSRYFNQRLLNYSQKCESDSDYFLCPLSFTEIAT